MGKPGDQLGYQLGGVQLAAPAFYILAITCFFFTFFNLRCGEAKLASMTGIDVVTGGEVNTSSSSFSDWMKPPPETGPDKRESIWAEVAKKDNLPVNYWLLAALVTGVAALAFSFYRAAHLKWVQLGLGAAAIVLMIVTLFTLNLYLLRILRLDGALKRRPQGLWNTEFVRLQPSWAFWCSLGAFVLALLMMVFRHQRLKIDREDDQVNELFEPGDQPGY